MHNPDQFTAWVHESIDAMTKNDEYIMNVAADADQTAKHAYLIAQCASNELKTTTDLASTAYKASRIAFQRSCYASNTTAALQNDVKQLGNNSGLTIAKEAKSMAKEALDIAQRCPTTEFKINNKRPDVNNALNNDADDMGKLSLFYDRKANGTTYEDIYYVDMTSTARRLYFGEANQAALWASNTIDVLAKSSDVDGKWASNQIETLMDTYDDIYVKADNALTVAATTLSSVQNDYMKKADVSEIADRASFASNTAQQALDRLKDTSPPIVHTIRSKVPTSVDILDPSQELVGKMVEVEKDIFFVDVNKQMKQITYFQEMDAIERKADEATTTARLAMEKALTANTASATATWASNVARWSSNQLTDYVNVSKAAYWSSNAIPMTSNVAFWSSNRIVDLSNLAYPTSNAAFWSSNTLRTLSNTAYLASNVAYGSSNAAYYASNIVSDVDHWGFDPNTYITSSGTASYALAATRCNVNIGLPNVLSHTLNINTQSRQTPSVGLYNTNSGLSSYVVIDAGYSIQSSAGVMDTQYPTIGFGADVPLRWLRNNKPDMELMRLTHTGRLGIGSTGPMEKLHVVGNAMIVGDVMRVGADLMACDQTIKDVTGEATLTELDQCQTFVKTVKLKKFKTKDSIQGGDNATRYGWIAQDVELNFPSGVSAVVSRDIPGVQACKMIKADQIYAMMYGAIQKLQARVQILESKQNQNVFGI